MKKSELVFSALLVPVDYLMLFLSGLIAYYLRFVPLFVELRPLTQEIIFQHYFKLILLVPVIFIIIFAMGGLYTIRNTRRWIDEMGSIFVAVTASMAIVIVIIFFQRELFSSRFIVLTGWALSVVMVMLGRLIVRIIQHLLLKKGVGVHNVVVIGHDSTSADIVKQIYKFPSLGYRITERFDDFSEATAKTLLAKMEIAPIDEIIQADTNLPKSQSLMLKDFCNDNHIIFKYATDLFEVQPTHIEINTIAGIPIIEVKKTKLDGWGKILKRILDMIMAGLVLIILSPVFLTVAVLILVDSAGPILVKLERIGEKGKTFTLYKFRSMVKNAHSLKKDLVEFNERADGPLFKIKNDPRITRIGKFLRRTSLDELPQFINVLKGQMSLVGPRPHEPEEVSKYERWQKKLLAIKPGITGLAQISGRSDLKFGEEAKLDIYYIENWSLKLDWQIVFKTPWVVLTGRSAS